MKVKRTLHGVAVLFMIWLCSHAVSAQAAYAKAWVDISASYSAIDPNHQATPFAYISGVSIVRGSYDMDGSSCEPPCDIFEFDFFVDPFCPYQGTNCPTNRISDASTKASVDLKMSHNRWEIAGTGDPSPESFRLGVTHWDDMSPASPYIRLGPNTHATITYSVHLEVNGGRADVYINGLGSSNVVWPFGHQSFPENVHLSVDGTGVVDQSFVVDLKNNHSCNHAACDGVTVGEVYWPFGFELSVQGSATPPIPEPSAYLLALAGMGVLAMAHRRRARRGVFLQAF